MREDFLHFVWKHQYFDSPRLSTVQGEKVHTLAPGITNRHSGPDFSEATVKIGELLWKGSVELHIRSSNWNDHNHHLDPAYNNVVLHVVWDHDKDVQRMDGTIMPTIEIKEHVPPEVLRRCNDLSNKLIDIPCAPHLAKVDPLTVSNVIGRCAIQRLQRRGRLFLELLTKNHNDWESTTIRALIQTFGFKTNQQAFRDLSEKVPVKILRRVSHERRRAEALLFGYAGLLAGTPRDHYQRKLQDEFRFLKQKYQLDGGSMSGIAWRYGGGRPQNLPTVRISQLAALFAALPNPFSVFRETTSVQSLIRRIMRVPPDDYWSAHFRFGKITKERSTHLGKASIESLIINVVAPLLAAYSNHTGEDKYLIRAQRLLEEISAEQNAKTRMWQRMGVAGGNAFETQGLTELFDSFCSNKSCLSCNIGTSIVTASDD